MPREILQIRVSVHEKARLKEEAARRGDLSVSDLVRDAVNKLLPPRSSAIFKLRNK